MSATTDLQSAWETEIAAKVTNPLALAKTNLILEKYIAALTSQSALEAKEIQSYSVAGRSITFRTVEQGTAAVEKLEDDLCRLVYGPMYASTVQVSLNSSRYDDNRIGV